MSVFEGLSGVIETDIDIEGDCGVETTRCRG
jgi:hypothetical protein